MAGKLLRCSFCTKSQDDVKCFISGMAGVLICSECVAFCSDILAKHAEPEPQIAASSPSPKTP